jgi:uncharacterized protein (TIGR02466 family)
METQSLFATPVFITDEYRVTPEELAAVNAQNWRGNVGGNRTSLDSHILERAELAGLKAFLLSQVRLFAHSVLKVRRECEFYITQSWVNVNEKGTQHHLHAHQNSVISGAFDFEGDNSPIVFQRPASHNLFGNIHLDFEELTLLNAGEYQFPARANRAMLFPSTTLHRVIPNKSDTPRISLAFNTFVRGRLGVPDDLSELRL